MTLESKIKRHEGGRAAVHVAALENAGETRRTSSGAGIVFHWGEYFKHMAPLSRVVSVLVATAGAHSTLAWKSSIAHSATRPLLQISSSPPSPSIATKAAPSLGHHCAASERLGYSSRTRMNLSVSDSMTETLAEALGASGERERFKVGGGGYGGGGGASVGTIVDNVTGDKFFYKMARGSDGSMLAAERAGLKAMYEAGAIRVPKPICGGTADGGSFAVFEYLNMGGRSSADKAELMGVQLARMHRTLSPNGKYGFDIDNTIGATPQPNGWKDTWAEFWVERRLKHMIKLSERDGAVFSDKEEVINKTRQILSRHKTVPSLVHGDLWGGNAGHVAPEDEPVIFDPATYYGDREVDMAMTHVFGGFSPAFYRGYEKEWPLEPGHEERQTVYNVYHMLNHYVLFGGGYLGSAQRMMGQILQM